MKRYIRFYAVTDAFKNSVLYAHETTEQILARYKNTDLEDSLKAFLESIPEPGEFIDLSGTIVMRAIDMPDVAGIHNVASIMEIEHDYDTS